MDMVRGYVTLQKNENFHVADFLKQQQQKLGDCATVFSKCLENKHPPHKLHNNLFKKRNEIKLFPGQRQKVILWGDVQFCSNGQLVPVCPPYPSVQQLREEKVKNRRNHSVTAGHRIIFGATASRGVDLTQTGGKPVNVARMVVFCCCC